MLGRFVRGDNSTVLSERLQPYLLGSATAMPSTWTGLELTQYNILYSIVYRLNDQHDTIQRLYNYANQLEITVNQLRNSGASPVPTAANTTIEVPDLRATSGSTTTRESTTTRDPARRAATQSTGPKRLKQAAKRFGTRATARSSNSTARRFELSQENSVPIMDMGNDNSIPEAYGDNDNNDNDDSVPGEGVDFSEGLPAPLARGLTPGASQPPVPQFLADEPAELLPTMTQANSASPQPHVPQFIVEQPPTTGQPANQVPTFANQPVENLVDAGVLGAEWSTTRIPQFVTNTNPPRPAPSIGQQPGGGQSRDSTKYINATQARRFAADRGNMREWYGAEGDDRTEDIELARMVLEEVRADPRNWNLQSQMRYANNSSHPITVMEHETRRVANANNLTGLQTRTANYKYPIENIAQEASVYHENAHIDPYRDPIANLRRGTRDSRLLFGLTDEFANPHQRFARRVLGVQGPGNYTSTH